MQRKYVKDKGREQPKIEESLDFAYFLGVLLGDSSIYSTWIKFSPKDPEFRAKIIEVGKKIVGKEPRVRIGKGDLVKIQFNSSGFIYALRSWLNFTGNLTEAFGSKSHNSDPKAFVKILEFSQTSRENAKAFIEGFYDSEGSCFRTRTYKILKSGNKRFYPTGYRITMTNTNKELLIFIQKLLVEFFQIESTIFLNRAKGCVVQHFPMSLHRERPQITTKDCWTLRIAKQPSVRHFAQSIRSTIPRKNPKLENF